MLSKSLKLKKYKKRTSEQEYNSAKANFDEAFTLGSRDMMKKIKEVIRHLADLTGLKRKHASDLQFIDLEGHQTEIDIEVKRLMKTFHSYFTSAHNSSSQS